MRSVKHGELSMRNVPKNILFVNGLGRNVRLRRKCLKIVLLLALADF